jgi:NHLM bacteriocin system ABC transporter ATP-binding protein
MLLQIVSAIAVIRLQIRMDYSAQAALWDRLLDLPATFFHRYSVGDLATRILNFSQIRQLISGAVCSTFLNGIFSVFSFALLFCYSPRLALVATGLAAVSVIVSITIGHLNTKYRKQTMIIEGKISGYVLQFITGIAKLKVAGAETRAYAVWSNLFSSQRRISFHLDNLNIRFQIFCTTFSAICSIAIYGFLSYGLKSADGLSGTTVSTISTGSFIAFMAAFGQFQSAMTQLGNMMPLFLQAVPLYERIQPILDAESESFAGRANPGELRGEIEVNSLSFRYNEKSPEILKNITLRINPGEFIAIVGPSGSGKSTLFRLLLGFEQPHAGAIYFDGKNMSELDLRRLRQQFGVVLQNGRILSGTILDNITGATRLTLDDAWVAARMAGLEDDIRQMPMQMHTFINAGGGTLSGGQRQRLLIARALAFKPKVILLDEATSALDNATQALIGESLSRLDATRIVIAHRLSTVVHADRIYVMKDGMIAEQGNYEELMSANGVFSQLSRRQIA